ncbi:hypothetical protein ACC687_39430, partial [Rhizobium ruizarguesonis]
SRFMGQPVPATGFSIGVSRLMTALNNLGKLGASEVIEPVLVTVMDGDVEAIGIFQLVAELLPVALEHLGADAGGTQFLRHLLIAPHR